jgi:DnaJ-domain-containing protein 1
LQVPKKRGEFQVWLESLDKALQQATGEGLVSHVGRIVSDLTKVKVPPSPAQQAEMVKEIRKKLNPNDPYVILGVPRDSPDWVVKMAYERKAKEVHPDKPGGSTEKMKRLNNAYDEIKKERKL